MLTVKDREMLDEYMELCIDNGMGESLSGTDRAHLRRFASIYDINNINDSDVAEFLSGLEKTRLKAARVALKRYVLYVREGIKPHKVYSTDKYTAERFPYELLLKPKKVVRSVIPDRILYRDSHAVQWR